MSATPDYYPEVTEFLATLKTLADHGLLMTDADDETRDVFIHGLDAALCRHRISGAGVHPQVEKFIGHSLRLLDDDVLIQCNPEHKRAVIEELDLTVGRSDAEGGVK